MDILQLQIIYSFDYLLSFKFIIIINPFLLIKHIPLFSFKFLIMKLEQDLILQYDQNFSYLEQIFMLKVLDLLSL